MRQCKWKIESSGRSFGLSTRVTSIRCLLWTTRKVTSYTKENHNVCLPVDASSSHICTCLAGGALRPEFTKYEESNLSHNKSMFKCIRSLAYGLLISRDAKGSSVVSHVLYWAGSDGYRSRAFRTRNSNRQIGLTLKHRTFSACLAPSLVRLTTFYSKLSGCTFRVSVRLSMPHVLTQ